MLSKFHKTTSKHWQRTSGTQKMQPVVIKRRSDKIEKIKRETKVLGMETCHRKGVIKQETFPNTRKHSHWWICGEFWNLRGQHNWEEK